MPGPRAAKGQKVLVDNPVHIIGRILKYIGKSYWLHLILVLVMIIIGVLANIQGTMFTKTLIDDYIMPMIGQPNPDFGPLTAAIGRVVIFYGCGVIAAFLQGYIMVYVTQGTLRNLRNELFDHMERLPISYFDRHPRGDIMSVYTNDVDALRQMISQSLPQLVNSALTIIATIVSMFILSIPLTIFSFIMLGVMVFCSKKFTTKSAKYFIAQQRELGSLDGYIEEMMSGQKVVKVFNHEEKAIEQFAVLNERLFDSANNANKNANQMMPANANLSYVSFVGSAIIGGAMALSGFMGHTIGGLASFLTFNRTLGRPISIISMEANSIIMALAGAERIFKLMDEPIETNEGKTVLVNVKEGQKDLVETEERTSRWAWKETLADGTTKLTELKGMVTFDDVDFGYVPEKTVLHGINLFAKPGQKIAFVGSTGAGKTTITNLINRFYDIQDGKIKYDGISINEIDKDSLRKSLGVVLQEANLFTGTVRDNIRYAKPDATDEEVVAAAKLANADSFIRKLPNGYDTVLSGNGDSLSQGQRQLLTIARVAVVDPPVIILDEATSSIDTRTERIVQEGMDRLMHGRTCFVIAHRLSTIKNADCIMVMEAGRIIERGTHEQLLAEKGRYYQLYTGKKAEKVIESAEQS